MTPTLNPLLAAGPLLLAATLAAAVPPPADPALTTWRERLAGGADPVALAQEFPAAAAEVETLNALRLALKAAGQAPLAQAFLAALAERTPTEAVLLNLSLSYVDQMQGKSLLRQGTLSTRSQEVAERISRQTPGHWAAWYIRGLNNLYWPDWFHKAPLARDALTEAVAIHRRLDPQAQDESDRYALGDLALGDAYALLDQPGAARAAWTRGRHAYPYVTVLRERLALADAELHRQVRAARDADQPIDTDLAFLWSNQAPPIDITVTGGRLYGPGPLDDQPLPPGRLANLSLGGTLNGFIPPMNNGAAEPNLPAEVRQGKTVDGLLSDGTPANENIDVGFVSLMNGKFNLFLAAVQDGPNQGRIHFFLDHQWNWTIRDDIGIDPGFPVGVIKIQEFTFSTSPRVLPRSRQSEARAPGGVDRAGSLPSGAVVAGALGDADFDGRLDGTFNAIGRFPYDAVILPGAPFAQTRYFTTPIPITPAQAAVLTLANALAWLHLAIERQADAPALAADLRKTYQERLETARRHGAGAADLTPAARNALALLTPDAGRDALCRAWGALAAAGAAHDLRRYDYNASGFTIGCHP